jgi:DNA-binding transcriptional LysR family regulator
MELRHLRDFVAVAEELNFSRAARKLRLAQPSLTRQIRNLEDELGVRLLDRAKGRVSLTEEGRSFMASAKRVLELSAESVEKVRRIHCGETGKLNIGYVANLHSYLLPATLSAFRTTYPNIALNLFDMTCAEQLQALAERRIDLGFVGLRESIQDTRLKGECIGQFAVLVALPRASSLAKKPKINLQDLEALFFVGFSERSYPGSRRWMNSIALQARFAPKILQEADQEAAMLRFVAAGLGAALLPEPIRSLPHEGVVFRRLNPPVQVESCIAWREDDPSEALAAYIQIVRGASGIGQIQRPSIAADVARIYPRRSQV